MGFVRGTASGLGAVAGGVFGMGYGGFVGFVGGAMVGTLVTDILLAILGFHIAAGRYVGIIKGIAAAGGSIAGMALSGIGGMMVGALVGSIIGDAFPP